MICIAHPSFISVDMTNPSFAQMAETDKNSIYFEAELSSVEEQVFRLNKDGFVLSVSDHNFDQCLSMKDNILFYAELTNA